MKAKQGRKQWKTVTAIGKWLKRYFNKRTTRKYDPDKIKLSIGDREIKGYTIMEEIEDMCKINDNKFIGGPLNG